MQTIQTPDFMQVIAAGTAPKGAFAGAPVADFPEVAFSLDAGDPIPGQSDPSGMVPPPVKAFLPRSISAIRSDWMPQAPIETGVPWHSAANGATQANRGPSEIAEMAPPAPKAVAALPPDDPAGLSQVGPEAIPSPQVVQVVDSQAVHAPASDPGRQGDSPPIRTKSGTERRIKLPVDALAGYTAAVIPANPGLDKARPAPVLGSPPEPEAPKWGHAARWTPLPSVAIRNAWAPLKAPEAGSLTNDQGTGDTPVSSADVKAATHRATASLAMAKSNLPNPTDIAENLRPEPSGPTRLTWVEPPVASHHSALASPDSGPTHALPEGNPLRPVDASDRPTEIHRNIPQYGTPFGNRTADGSASPVQPSVPSDRKAVVETPHTSGKVPLARETFVPARPATGNPQDPEVHIPPPANPDAMIRPARTQDTATPADPTLIAPEPRAEDRNLQRSAQFDAVSMPAAVKIATVRPIADAKSETGFPPVRVEIPRANAPIAPSPAVQHRSLDDQFVPLAQNPERSLALPRTTWTLASAAAPPLPATNARAAVPGPLEPEPASWPPASAATKPPPPLSTPEEPGRTQPTGTPMAAPPTTASGGGVAQSHWPHVDSRGIAADRIAPTAFDQYTPKAAGSPAHTMAAAIAPAVPGGIPNAGVVPAAFDAGRTGTTARADIEPALAPRSSDGDTEALPANPITGLAAPAEARAEAPATRTPVAPEVPLPRHVAAQLTEVARAMPDGPVELTLNPEELGRVRMTLTATDTTMKVFLGIERNETADLMRRHIDTLAQEFRALGYRDVAFEFSGGQERPGNRPAQNQPDPQPADAPQNTSASPQPDSRSGIVAAGGMDLRL